MNVAGSRGAVHRSSRRWGACRWKPQPSHAEVVPNLECRALDEVGQRLALLLVEVLAVLLTGLADGLEPRVAAHPGCLRDSRIALRILLWSRDGVVGLVLGVPGRSPFLSRAG